MGSLGTRVERACRASIPPALCLLTSSLGPFLSLSLTPVNVQILEAAMPPLRSP